MDYNNLCLGCMEEKDTHIICPYCAYEVGTDSESPQHLPPGTVLQDKYLIGRVLGQGGFGITYLALDTTLHLKLAIKEYLPQELATRSGDRKKVTVNKASLIEQFEYGLTRFLEEARTLARFIEHPNVVSVRDYFEANGTAYLVMNYHEGLTLESYLDYRGGSIPVEQALPIFMPVLDALKEVHNAGILHRDISPDNLLIDNRGRVIVIDFGAARQEIREKSRAMSVILKAGYAPEEQHRSRGEQGPWTDIYAVSATIYRAIVGEKPPEAIDRLAEDILITPSGQGVEISREVEKVLMKGLAVRSKDRYHNTAEFQQAFIDAQKKPEPVSQEKYISCPYCGEEIHRRAVKCKYCYSLVDDEGLRKHAKGMKNYDDRHDLHKEPVVGMVAFFICLLLASFYLFASLGGVVDTNDQLAIALSLIAIILSIIGLAQSKNKKTIPLTSFIFAIVLLTIASFNLSSPPETAGSNTIITPEVVTDSQLNVPKDYATIQEAIDSEPGGAVITVAEGTYRENIDFKGKDITLRSTDPGNPNLVAKTIIDGGNNGPVVTFNSGEGSNAILSGFTITGGSGVRKQFTITSYDGQRLSFDRRYAGGILIAGGSSPTIKDNIITGNNARNLSARVLGVGGGIAVLDNSSPLIENNTISDNNAEAYGGGIVIWHRSDPTLRDNIIKNNRAGDIGGGIMIAMMCKPEIVNNTIQGNHSANWSGGVYIAHMSEGKLTGNTIAQNTAVDGAGLFIRRTEAVSVRGNEIKDNRASGNGGAIYMDNRAEAIVNNNLISGNVARSGGGIWVDRDSTLRIASPDDNTYQNNTPGNIYRR